MPLAEWSRLASKGLQRSQRQTLPRLPCAAFAAQGRIIDDAASNSERQFFVHDACLEEDAKAPTGYVGRKLATKDRGGDRAAAQ